MKTKLKLILACSIMSLAGNAFAQTALPTVNGVQATAQAGIVTVTWNPIQSAVEPIAYYRVYFGEQSILDHDGIFDDFEVTDGPETSLNFSAPDFAEELYIAVIAVGESGIESEFFTEEAHVMLGSIEAPQEASSSAPASSSSSSSSQPTVHTQQQTIRLLSADVFSPTQIAVGFSAPITVDPQKAPMGLSIVDGKGVTLPITSITIDGAAITINTAEQTRGVVYNIRFQEPFVGLDGTPLDTEDRSVFVTGHTNGVSPVQTSHEETQDEDTTPETAPHVDRDLMGVTLKPQARQDGLYNLIVEWETDTFDEEIYGILVHQTRDGRTFGSPEILPPNIRGIKIDGVTVGFYGLYLQTIGTDGSISRGVFHYANLPEYIPGSGLQGSITLGSLQPTEPIDFSHQVADDAQFGTISPLQPYAVEDAHHSSDALHAAAVEEEVSLAHFAILLLATIGTGAVLSSGVLYRIKHQRSFAEKNSEA